jgi:hypothetical protein
MVSEDAAAQARRLAEIATKAAHTRVERYLREGRSSEEVIATLERNQRTRIKHFTQALGTAREQLPEDR